MDTLGGECLIVCLIANCGLTARPSGHEEEGSTLVGYKSH